MASLIPESGMIFNFADVAPPPSKDYCQILVTTDSGLVFDLVSQVRAAMRLKANNPFTPTKMIIFRLWKISLKNTSVCPTEVKDTYEDFLCDELTKGEVHRAFGKNFLEYIKGLAHGNIDYLPRLSRSLLVKIICFLDLEDIPKLAMVSKQFLELCNSDDVWKQFYYDHNQTVMSAEMSSLAEAIGWKKLFFTNKLQLQMKLRRHTAAKAVHSSSLEGGDGDDDDDDDDDDGLWWTAG
ncbi:hypothetical protein LSH36_84g05055 [Paralvinella palmiformis]|uniref:F-box domain-containing protein n=1 Tax=Paralvinella palmiformis TaxID=53620 RepID=A0AAD9K1J1_9ANNE|nr:hypothetical protein LSH36_84g05055 [Paralvinella palmiformis]